MRPGLFILPFLAMFFGAMATALRSSFGDMPWIAYIGYAIAATLVLLWIVLDLENFKSVFRRKGARYGFSSGLSVLMGLLVIVGICVLSSRPRFNKSYDATRTGNNTLSDQSKKIIQTLKEKKVEVDVTAFFQDEPSKQQFTDLINLYGSQGADFKTTYVNPQTEPTKAMAEKITSGNTVIFRAGPQESRLTTFSEEKITNALLKMVKDRARKVYFTSGHGEGDVKSGEATGFQNVVTELESNKYDIATVSLLETTKVPDDADLLVIAGPRYDFKEEETRFVEDYLHKGGALMVMVDAVQSVPTLNKSLEKFGLRYNSDILILRPDDPRAMMIGQNNAIVSDFDKLSPITRDFASQSQVQVVMPNARSISEVTANPNEMKVQLVGKTNPAIIEVKNVERESDLRNITRERIATGSFAVIAASTGKSKTPLTAGNVNSDPNTKKDVAAGAEKPTQKEVRVVAVGSSQFATNGGTQRAENKDLFVNITNYLLQDEDFISIRPKDNDKSTIQLTTSGSQLALAFLAFIYPFLFLGGGVVYWLKRRRA